MFTTILFFVTILKTTNVCAQSLQYGWGNPDYYAVLGIQRDAPKRLVKRGYRQMALILHPDKNQCDDEASDKFVLLRKSFEVLYNRRKRFEYNLENPKAGKNGKSFDWKLPELCNQDPDKFQHHYHYKNYLDMEKYLEMMEDIPFAILMEIERRSYNLLKDLWALYIRIIIPLESVILRTKSWYWDCLYGGALLFSSAKSLSRHWMFHSIVTLLIGFAFLPLLFLAYSTFVVIRKICFHTVIAVGILGYVLHTNLIQETYTSVVNKYPIFIFVILYNYPTILVFYSILNFVLATYFQHKLKTHELDMLVKLLEVVLRVTGIYAVWISVNTINEAIFMIIGMFFCHYCLTWCVKATIRMPKVVLSSIYRLISGAVSRIFIQHDC